MDASFYISKLLMSWGCHKQAFLSKENFTPLDKSSCIPSATFSTNPFSFRAIFALSIASWFPTIKLLPMYIATYTTPFSFLHIGTWVNIASNEFCFLQNLNGLFYNIALLPKQDHRCTCLNWCHHLYSLCHSLGTFHINLFFVIAIEEDCFDADYFSQEAKWMTIRSRMKNVMSSAMGN